MLIEFRKGLNNESDNGEISLFAGIPLTSDSIQTLNCILKNHTRKECKLIEHSLYNVAPTN